jgi:arylsulfatase A-like enzyme
VRPLLIPFLFALACSKPAPNTVRRPDVFLIVVDTLRADHLGCYGYPRPSSPNLDRLAAEGAVFEDATSQASWTRLSMVSMLQGHYVTDYRDVFEEKAPTLAEVFHQAGYRTVGEVANILLSADAGFGRGFDHYDARGPSKEDKASDG